LLNNRADVQSHLLGNFFSWGVVKRGERGEKEGGKEKEREAKKWAKQCGKMSRYIRT
jgi:hypothetical protein